MKKFLDFAQVTEISKSLVKSYRSKAGVDVWHKSQDFQNKRFGLKHGKNDKAALDKSAHKLDTRLKYLKKTDPLRKESVDIQELSTKKLVQYGKASKKDVDNQMNKRNDKKVVNRVKGGQLARKKILGGAKVPGKNFPKRNESKEITELSKGTLRKYFTGSYNDSTERRGKVKDNRDLSPADKKKEASRNKYRTIAAKKIAPKPASVSAKSKAAKAKYQFQQDKANESVEIQELSKNTLGSYIKKSMKNKEEHDKVRGRATTRDSHVFDNQEKSYNKSANRKIGILRATDKLVEK